MLKRSCNYIVFNPLRRVFLISTNRLRAVFLWEQEMANTPGRANSSPPKGKVQVRTFGIGHTGTLRALRADDEEEEARIDDVDSEERTDDDEATDDDAARADDDADAEDAERTDDTDDEERTDDADDEARTDDDDSDERTDDDADTDTERADDDASTDSNTTVDGQSEQTEDSRAEWLKLIQYDEAKRTVRIPFSSDEPVDRWYGTEILSHEAGAVRIDVRQKFMNLLYNHDMNMLLGRVLQVDLENGRTYGTVRFGNDELGKWALGQVLDEILVNVSIRYEVYKWMEDVEAQSYTAMDWEPVEYSMVTVPADATVGGGRSLDGGDNLILKGNEMKFNQRKQNAVAENVRTGGGSKSDLAAQERKRAQEITALCRAHGVSQKQMDQMIADGTSISAARGIVLTDIAKRNKDAGNGAVADLGNDFNPDMTRRERDGYSMIRALTASLSGNWEKAGFEREVSDAILKASGRTLSNEGAFMMPTNLQFAAKRDYSTATPGSGGNLVATDLLAGSFIEMLRNKARVMQLGATVLSGLVGNVDIPSQLTASAPAWFTEGNGMPKTDATFGKLSLALKSLGTYGLITRNMLLQSTPDIEMLVRADLIAMLALGVDLAALSGTGLSGQPRGIANTSGIKSILGGTNGANLTLDHIIDMETSVEESNADSGNLAYLVNPRSKGYLKKAKSTTGQYLWTDSPTGGRSATPGVLNGHDAAITNQARSNLTKGTANGVCSELFFGAWNEVVIGEWGVVEVLPNPYHDSAFASGGLLIRAAQSVDVGLRHAQAFAVMSDALTPQ
jgi:HK97 family phage major capsid protein